MGSTTKMKRRYALAGLLALGTMGVTAAQTQQLPRTELQGVGSGIGVYGAGSGIGVYGAGSGIGVYGAGSGIGVYGAGSGIGAPGQSNLFLLPPVQQNADFFQALDQQNAIDPDDLGVGTFE